MSDASGTTPDEPGAPYEAAPPDAAGPEIAPADAVIPSADDVIPPPPPETPSPERLLAAPAAVVTLVVLITTVGLPFAAADPGAGFLPIRV